MKGKRCYGQHDWRAKARTNVIGAQLNGKLTTVCTFDCHINSDIFYAWVTQDLLLKSPPGAVLVMDNVSFHKRQDIQSARQKAGFILEYLLTYFPDMNPIEHKWAQAKALRRKRQCDIDTLFYDPLF
ncbi:transposase [Candidatus Fukatsuia endosymbiont of Tuberolachnus salignus]|uniref:transposase n=1 Tax=Candidatus Fukatsuia endosymbiont of Tuberolachnus salignus TaxID=3077957 RepID=UPI00313C5428